MRAIQQVEFGGPEVLELVEVPIPEPAEGEVLVRVARAGMNFADTHQREDQYVARQSLPLTPGSEVAGVREDTGERVVAMCGHGGYAEYAVAPADRVFAIPDGLDDGTALALLLQGLTAWHLYRTCARIAAGESVLVVSGAGGVGSLAVQLAKNAGATVIGLASEPNHEWLRAHGIVPVAYGEGVADRIRAAARGSVDAFVDTFGGGYVDLAVELGVAPDRIDTIIDYDGAQRHGAKMDANAAGASAATLAELAGELADGRLDLPVARTYPLAEVQAAYRDLERRHTRGKIVLIP
jgi:NADPH2:quinone reductase